jgi:type IV secretion system protein VirB2
MTEQLKSVWKVCLIALFSVFLGLISPVYESKSAENLTDKNQITNILCNVTNIITGGVGRTIAILIVISLAIALFLGKVTWGMAIAVAVGMGVLFGAKDLVKAISGTDADVC